MEIPRILIVEDDGIIARHLQAVLKKFGYQVQAMVPSGEEALLLAEQALPDLVLMDIELAGDLDGVQTAEQFQARFQTPVVYLTAFAGDQLVQRAKLTNPFGYITKPFEERHLHATLELALQKHHYERELQAKQERYLAVVSQASEGIVLIDAITTQVVETNAAFLDLVGLSGAAIIGKPLYQALSIHHEPFIQAVESLNRERQLHMTDEIFHRVDGQILYLDITATLVRSPHQTLICAIARDVTGRHLAEVKLREETQERQRAQDNYRSIFENAAIGIYQASLSGRFSIVNPALAKMFGYASPQEMIEQVTDLATQVYAWPDRRQEVLAAGLSADGFVEIENEYRRKDGSIFYGMAYFRVIRGEDGQPRHIEGFVQDVTERRQSQEAMRASEERYRNIYNHTPAMLHSIDAQGRLVSVSDYWLEMLGYTRDEVIGRSFIDFMPEEARRYAREVVLPAFQHSGMCKNVPQQVVKKNGEVLDVLLSAISEQDGAGQSLRGLSVFVDVTERNRAEQKLQMQLRRMASLRAVEMSITARMDLRDTLETLLEQVIAQLGVDAACVLLFNPRTQTLEDAADSGFRTANIKSTHLHLGEGLAGLAAVDRRMVSANNLSSQIEAQRYVPYLLSEGFVSYYGMPLIVKGVVKGVLEVYHRSLLNPPAEWLEFLEALAGHAAIAIDNKALFEEEQRANFKLTRAFDATIEGWSRAQGLRDPQTEAHAERVSRLTLDLAGYLGVPANEMDHLRRGALLHDIGKMGLPDTILMNPGPLTPEEWEQMRKHPQYAFEWLSSIDFLRPALDIPYCHHERWNGSGYPRGLKGTQIPLSARIFAVIDVYDSLNSDRRYRPSMHEVEVLRYLQDQAGLLFEPEIVQAFVNMLKER